MFSDVSPVKQIAVFCALPPERNTGMATVDLAALCVIGRIVPDAEVTLYTYGNPSNIGYKCGELPYTYLNVEEHREQYFASDVFIFWGDFTHSRSYWTIDRAYHNAIKNCTSEVDAGEWNRRQFDDASQYIFLTSLPESRLRNVIVFGSTIITNDARDETARSSNTLDTVYYKRFRHFFTHVRTVLFRDAVSAARISPFRGNEASLGCDCALLLQDSDLESIPGFVAAPVRKGVGVFFGRCSSKTKMMIFARLVARQLGQRSSWLPWFLWYPSERTYRLKAATLGFSLSSEDVDTGLLLSSLSGYGFIITDTYHLCINAWRMGIPAVCIGEGAADMETSLNDKKKEILYEMYGARSLYVFLERVRSIQSFAIFQGLRAESKRVAIALQNNALVSQICDNIALHREMAESRLAEALLAALDEI